MWYFSEQKVNPSRHGGSAAHFLSSSGWRTRSRPSVAQTFSRDQITSVALENGSLSWVWPFPSLPSLNSPLLPLNGPRSFCRCYRTADKLPPATRPLSVCRASLLVAGPSYRKRRSRSLHIPHDEECAPVEKGAEVWSRLQFPDWVLIPDQPGNCLELKLYSSITHKKKSQSLAQIRIFICVKQSNTSVQCKTFLSP